MLKKVAAVILSLVMCVSLLSGCGESKEDGSKDVTLNWYFFIGEQKELKRANAYVNELLEELLPNTKLNLVQDSGFDSKWSMWMAAGEPIDIAWTGYMVSMINEVAADSYLELDDLIDEYGPAVKEERNEFSQDYLSGVYKGKTYAIPNLQPIMHQTPYVSIPAELYEYFPTEEFLAEAKKSTKTTARMYDILTEFLKTVYDKGLADSDTIGTSFDCYHMLEALVSRGYDWVGSKLSGAYLCYDAFDDKAPIECFFQTDAFKMYIDYASKWYKAGYIPKDVLVSSSKSGGERSAIFAEGSNEIHFDETSDSIKEIKDSDGNVTEYRILLNSYNQMFNGTVIFGSYATYTCIPQTCSNPERAMKLINLLKTDEGNELFNAIIYGVEGRHYTKDDSDPDDIVAYGDDYVIQADNYSKYGIPHWEVGNVYKAYRTPNILKGQKKYCLDFIKNIKPNCRNTKYKDLQFDFSDNSTVLQNVSDTVNEFYNTLLYGVKGDKYNEYYGIFMTELANNGVDTLIASAEEQAKEQTN